MPPSWRLRAWTSRLLAGPPCGRTSSGALRSSAPHRRRHAGPPRPCPPPPGHSTVNSLGATGKAAGAAACPPLRRRAPQQRGGSPAPQATDRREALRFWREGARTAASQPPRAARSTGDPARRAGHCSGGRAAVPAALRAPTVERQQPGKGTTAASSPYLHCSRRKCRSGASPVSILWPQCLAGQGPAHRGSPFSRQARVAAAGGPAMHGCAPAACGRARPPR
mgnify:CR=1 FL=1